MEWGAGSAQASLDLGWLENGSRMVQKANIVFFDSFYQDFSMMSSDDGSSEDTFPLSWPPWAELGLALEAPLEPSDGGTVVPARVYTPEVVTHLEPSWLPRLRIFFTCEPLRTLATLRDGISKIGASKENIQTTQLLLMLKVSLCRSGENLPVGHNLGFSTRPAN